MSAFMVPDEWKSLAEEKSIRGEVVRLALQRMQDLDVTEQELVHEAVELLLARFAGSQEAEA